MQCSASITSYSCDYSTGRELRIGNGALTLGLKIKYSYMHVYP